MSVELAYIPKPFLASVKHLYLFVSPRLHGGGKLRGGVSVQASSFSQLEVTLTRGLMVAGICGRLCMTYICSCAELMRVARVDLWRISCTGTCGRRFLCKYGGTHTHTDIHSATKKDAVRCSSYLIDRGMFCLPGMSRTLKCRWRNEGLQCS